MLPNWVSLRGWSLLLLLLVGSPLWANVFGRDRRVVPEGRGPEFEHIGLVRQRDSQQRTVETCTGTLIASRLVVTAAHCVGTNQGKLSPEIKTEFLSGFSENRLPAGVRVAQAIDAWVGGWKSDADSRGGDWAVLLLDVAPWGDAARSRPYFSVRETLPRTGAALASIGYSSDFKAGRTPSADFECRLRGVTSDKVIHHDCAVFAGASGGPLLALGGDGHWGIVGIHNAHKSQGSPGLKLARFLPQFANLGVAVERVVSSVRIASARTSRGDAPLR